jgi:CBS domain-containing protein
MKPRNEDVQEGSAMARTSRKATGKHASRPRTQRSGVQHVEAVMIPNPVTIEADATLLATAELMREANVGILPVMDGPTLRGVVTDRDLVIRAMTRDVRPSEERVGECLSEPAQCAEPGWTVDEAMEEMARQQVGRLPVIDPEGRVVGIITLSSLALRSRKPAETLEAAQKVSRRSTRAA